MLLPPQEHLLLGRYRSNLPDQPADQPLPDVRLNSDELKRSGSTASTRGHFQELPLDFAERQKLN